jgi:hypothetical protein
MNQKRESMASQRFSRALDRTDRASRAMGIRSSIYMGSSFDLHWKKDEEDWFTTSLSSESPTIESPSSEAPLRKTAPLKEKTKEKEPPPADKGRRAYLFMLSAFIIEAIMWGEFIVFSSLVNLMPQPQPSVFCLALSFRLHTIPFLEAPKHRTQLSKISSLSIFRNLCISISEISLMGLSSSEGCHAWFMQVTLRPCYRCHESPYHQTC